MEKREELDVKLAKIINGVKGNLAKGVIIGDITEENYEEKIKSFLNDEIGKFNEDEIKEFFLELILSTFKKEFEKMKSFYDYEDSEEEHNIRVFKVQKDEKGNVTTKEATENDLKNLSEKLNSNNKEKESEEEKHFNKYNSAKKMQKELPNSIEQILNILLGNIKK